MSRPTTAADRWVRCFHPAAEAARRLVCLPHAGGAAGFFFPLSATPAPEAEVRAVRYPGRRDRLAEPAYTDVHALADHATAALGGDCPVGAVSGDRDPLVDVADLDRWRLPGGHFHLTDRPAALVEVLVDIPRPLRARR